MTVLLLRPYATFAQGATVDLDNATEAALVGQERASYVGASPGAAFAPLTPQEMQAVRDFGPAISSMITPILWADRPTASLNSGLVITVSDVGNGSQWRSDGTDYVPVTPVFLYHSNTQVVGAAQIAAQQLGVTTAIPRSRMIGCRYTSVNYQLSKSATADIVTTYLYVGTAGTSADTLILQTVSFLAANRQTSNGLLLRYNSSTSKLQSYSSSSGASLEALVVTASVHPNSQSAAMADVDQFFSLYVSCNVGSDVPALERLSVIGY